MKSDFVFVWLLLYIMYFCASCSKDENNGNNLGIDNDAKVNINSMVFTSYDNPDQLIENITCSIKGDSIVECWIPYLVANKKLIARFDCEGGGGHF